MDRSELAGGANPYWVEVAAGVTLDEYGLRQVGDSRDSRDFGNGGWFAKRRPLATRYAWTITAPDTVNFVAHHAGPRLLDPMAGTGYWAALLQHQGVDVAAFDTQPPGPDNPWHPAHGTWTAVGTGDAVDVAADHSDRTLLLAWPPYDTPTGAEILAAYRGDRVIYIGEGAGGCCGNDALFATFGRSWWSVAEHAPVQWLGIHDYITVYERKEH